MSGAQRPILRVFAKLFQFFRNSRTVPCLLPFHPGVARLHGFRDLAWKNKAMTLSGVHLRLADMVERVTQTLAATLHAGGRAMAVEVAEVSGSAPRDCDAVMIVTADAIHGTIGGGALEWTAVEHARDLLGGIDCERRMILPLGPVLGQCCGGRVVLEFHDADEAYAARLSEKENTTSKAFAKVVVFGAGHVGRALARTLLPLPFSALYVDSRETELARLPIGAEGKLAEDPLSFVRDAERGTSFVIMTHAHTQDFILLDEALRRSDAPYIGMIGSATKRASFMSWARAQRGGKPVETNFVCPVGGNAVDDKRPAVIAALVAAELLVKVHAPLLSRQTETQLVVSEA